MAGAPARPIIRGTLENRGIITGQRVWDLSTPLFQAFRDNQSTLDEEPKPLPAQPPLSSGHGAQTQLGPPESSIRCLCHSKAPPPNLPEPAAPECYYRIRHKRPCLCDDSAAMKITDVVSTVEMEMKESQNQRDKRVEELWRKLDPQEQGELDFKGLQKGLRRIDHR